MQATRRIYGILWWHSGRSKYIDVGMVITIRPILVWLGIDLPSYAAYLRTGAYYNSEWGLTWDRGVYGRYEGTGFASYKPYNRIMPRREKVYGHRQAQCGHRYNRTGKGTLWRGGSV